MSNFLTKCIGLPFFLLFGFITEGIHGIFVFAIFYGIYRVVKSGWKHAERIWSAIE